ncbi:MAG TPA: hypothetical protein VFS40_09565 [Gemmatimonadales bacterium]|nr:hypothetical protein [Gemmatimonadales bacterium]
MLAARIAPALREGCAVRFATGISVTRMLVPVTGTYPADGARR